jgi:hypothetical protein
VSNVVQDLIVIFMTFCVAICSMKVHWIPALSPKRLQDGKNWVDTIHMKLNADASEKWQHTLFSSNIIFCIIHVQTIVWLLNVIAFSMWFNWTCILSTRNKFRWKSFNHCQNVCPSIIYIYNDSSTYMYSFIMCNFNICQACYVRTLSCRRLVCNTECNIQCYFSWKNTCHAIGCILLCPVMTGLNVCRIRNTPCLLFTNMCGHMLHVYCIQYT